MREGGESRGSEESLMWEQPLDASNSCLPSPCCALLSSQARTIQPSTDSCLAMYLCHSFLTPQAPRSAARSVRRHFSAWPSTVPALDAATRYGWFCSTNAVASTSGRGSGISQHAARQGQGGTAGHCSGGLQEIKARGGKCTSGQQAAVGNEGVQE